MFADVFHRQAQIAASLIQVQRADLKDSLVPAAVEIPERNKIVHELEKGEVPLEKSLTLFEEGMQLSATCKKQLEDAEGKVEILLKQNGKLQSEPFEPPAGKVARK